MSGQENSEFSDDSEVPNKANYVGPRTVTPNDLSKTSKSLNAAIRTHRSPNWDGKTGLCHFGLSSSALIEDIVQAFIREK